MLKSNMFKLKKVKVWSFGRPEVVLIKSGFGERAKSKTSGTITTQLRCSDCNDSHRQEVSF